MECFEFTLGIRCSTKKGMAQQWQIDAETAIREGDKRQIKCKHKALQNNRMARFQWRDETHARPNADLKVDNKERERTEARAMEKSVWQSLSK